MHGGGGGGGGRGGVNMTSMCNLTNQCCQSKRGSQYSRDMRAVTGPDK